MKRELKFRAFVIRSESCDSINKMRYERNETIFQWRADGVTMEIMQFTGLLDKTGKEIYEGDILKFFDRPIAVVEWQDFGGWSYRWIDETYKRVRQYNPEPFFRNINLWEVIGNIYEHPHLLTEDSTTKKEI